MAKRDAGEAMLAHLFGDDHSVGDSDCESSQHAGSVGSDGDSLFGELSVDSANLKDMYGQSGCQDGDDSDNDTHRSGVNPVDDVAISKVSQHKNNAEGAAQNFPSFLFKSSPNATAASYSPSDVRGDAYYVSVGSIIGKRESIVDITRTPYAQNCNESATNCHCASLPSPGDGDMNQLLIVVIPYIIQESSVALRLPQLLLRGRRRVQTPRRTPP